MTDTNQQSEGESAEYKALERAFNISNRRINDLIREVDQLKYTNAALANGLLNRDKTIEELRAALKVCVDGLMYESTMGNLWMWARSNEAVNDKFLEIRKLVYP
jgi:hypothetical protein